jgi:hypothetical protein
VIELNQAVSTDLGGRVRAARRSGSENEYCKPDFHDSNPVLSLLHSPRTGPLPVTSSPKLEKLRNAIVEELGR